MVRFTYQTFGMCSEKKFLLHDYSPKRHTYYFLFLNKKQNV